MAFKSRILDRSIIGQYLVDHWTYSTITGLWSYNQIGPTSYGTRYHTRNYYNRGWNTLAGWKALRASQGWLPTQAMSETQEQWTQPRPTVTYHYTAANGADQKAIVHGDAVVIPAFDESSGLLTTVERSALQVDAQHKCLSHARDMKVNLPVMFGEGRQTVRMIADTARTLGKAYRNFRRGRFRQAARDLGIQKPTGTAANHWLAYNYGWMPLLYDAKGLVELAAQQVGLGGRPRRIKVTGKAYSVKRGSFTTVGQGALYVGGNTIHKYESRGTAKAGLLLEIEHTEAALAAQTGLGVTDPLLTAWELTPFSFVFDWFIDVGGWLEMCSSLQGMKVLAGFSSVLEARKLTSQVSSLPNRWSLAGGSYPKCEAMHRSYSRTHWSGSVTTVRTPLWDALNARRIVTTASLWRQRTRGDRDFGKYRP